MQDEIIHKGLRTKMIEEIQKKGIATEEVLSAMSNVPRHFFMDKVFYKSAYEDRPFSIGYEQTISQPSTVAFQTSLLNVKPYLKILEIGTGSGYQAAVLAEMKANVFTIERQRGLYLNSKKILNEKYHRIKVFFGDGYKGLPSYAPFDRILITCAAPYIPEELLNQLKEGGILVIPVDTPTSEDNEDSKYQTMRRLTKISSDQFQSEEFGNFRFVPMLKDKKY